MIAGLVVFGVLAADPAAAGTDAVRESLAVMPVSAQRLSTGEREALELALADATVGLVEYEVVSTLAMRDKLGESALQQAQGCADTLCFAQMGNALGARVLLSVNAGRLGEEVILSAKLIDVVDARVRRRSSRSVARGAQDAAVAGLVRELFSAVEAGPASSAGVDVVPVGLTRGQYAAFLRSGRRYDQWAHEYNLESESLALEIGKWVVTALAGLALVGTLRGGFDQEPAAWAGEVVIVGTAATLWTIDLQGIGEAPAELP